MGKDGPRSPFGTIVDSPEVMRDRCRGFLIGTAVGDAMGVPLEGTAPCPDIEPDTYWDGFLPIPGEAPGRTSDDTQLVALTMIALQSDGTFRPETLAQLMTREFERNSTMGWGLATYTAVARIVYEGETWESCACPEGVAGNGPAMRAGPLGLWPWPSSEHRERAAFRAARLTHTDARSVAGAAGIATGHAYALACPRFSRDDFTAAVLASVEPHSTEMASVLDETFRETDLRAAVKRLSEHGAPEVRGPVSHGIPGYVVPSVALALHLFSLFPAEPRKSLCLAMSAGGDTDTVGSMVGGLTGTLNGSEIWPDHLASNVRGYESLLRIADAFADACWERMSMNGGCGIGGGAGETEPW